MPITLPPAPPPWIQNAIYLTPLLLLDPPYLPLVTRPSITDSNITWRYITTGILNHSSLEVSRPNKQNTNVNFLGLKLHKYCFSPISPAPFGILLKADRCRMLATARLQLPPFGGRYRRGAATTTFLARL